MRRTFRFRDRWREQSRAILIVAAFLVVLIAAFVPVRIFVNARVDALKQDVISKLERSLGAKITYKKASPAFLSRLNVTDIKISGPLYSVEIGRSTVYLSIPALIFGRSPEKIIARIDLDHVDAHILTPPKDERADALAALNFNEADKIAQSTETQRALSDLIDKVFTILEGEGKPLIPFIPITVSCKAVNIDYVTELGVAMGVSNAFFSVSPSGEGYAVDLVGPAYIRQVKSPPGVPAPLSLQGVVSGDLSSGNLKFGVQGFAFPAFFVDKQSARLAWGSGRLELRKIADNLPLDYVVSIDSSDRSVYASVVAEKFKPENFMARKERAQIENQRAINSFDGMASLIIYPDRGVYYYQAVAGMSMRLFNGDADLKINVAGDNALAQIRALSFNSNRINADFRGDVAINNLFPAGRLTVGLPGKSPVNTGFTFINRGDRLDVKGDDTMVGGVNTGAFNAVVDAKSGAYAMVARHVRDGMATASLDLSYDTKLSSGSARFTGNAFDLTPFVVGKALPGVLAGWKGDWAWSATVESGKFFVDGSEFALRKDATHGVSLAFTADNDQIRVQNMGIAYGPAAVKLAFISSLSAQPEFSGALSTQSMSYGFTGSYKAGLAKILNPYGSIDFDAVKGVLSAKVADMPLSSNPVDPLKFTLNASAEKGSTGYLVTLNRVMFLNGALDARLENGTFGLSSGRLNRIYYRDGISTLTGTAAYMKGLRGDMTATFALGDGRGVENYSAKLVYGRALSGQVRVDRFPLARTGVPTLEGEASFQLDVASPAKDILNNLASTLSFNVAGFYKNDRIVAKADATLKPGLLAVTGLNAQYGSWLAKGGVINVNYGAKTVAISSNVSAIDGSMSTGVGLYLTSESPLSLGSLGSFFNKDFKGILGVDMIQFHGRRAVPPLRFAVTRRGSVYGLRDLDDMNLVADFDVDAGTFNLAANKRTGIIADVSGVTSRGGMGDFKVDVKRLSIPLPHFNPFLSMPSGKRIIAFDGGRSETSMTITQGPTLNGSIRFDGGYIESPYNPGPKGKMDGRVISFVNSEMMAGPWYFPNMKGGDITLFANVIMAPKLRYKFRVDVAGSRGTPFSFDVFNLVSFYGNVLGWTEFNGDGDVGYLTGELRFPYTSGSLGDLPGIAAGGIIETPRYLTKKVVKPGFRLIAGTGEKAARVMALSNVIASFGSGGDASNRAGIGEETSSFRLVSGNDFTFYLPSEALPTIVATLRPNQGVDVILDVTNNGSSTGYLIGDLEVRRGSINYFGKGFDIQDGGLIRFNDEYLFNPLLLFDAELKHDPNMTAAITMHFKNRGFDNYSPTFTSTDPTMTQERIIASLGASLAPGFINAKAGLNPNTPGYGTLTGNTGTANATTSIGGTESANAFEGLVKTGGDAAGSFFTGLAEGALRKLPFIDMVSIKTSVLSNFALDKLVDRGDIGSLYARDQSSVLDYLAGTSLSVGKYVGDNMFVQLSAGVAKIQRQTRYVGQSDTLTPTFGIDLRFNTPLFLIDWNFNPVQTNASRLFVPDVSVTLTKKFTFKDWSELYAQLFGSGGKDY